MIGYSVLNTQSVAGASSPEVGVSRPACCQEALCETPPSQTPPPSGGSCHSLACGWVVPGSSSTAMLFLPWPHLTTSPPLLLDGHPGEPSGSLLITQNKPYVRILSHTCQVS